MRAGSLVPADGNEPCRAGGWQDTDQGPVSLGALLLMCPQVLWSHIGDVPLLLGVEKIGVSYSSGSLMCLYNLQSPLMT